MTSIILTGGTSRRFGSDKSAAMIGNITLLEFLIANLRDTDLIIVGPETGMKARYVREKPIHSGPVAGIHAAIDFVDNDYVSIFATDMPFSPILLPQLRNELKDDAALPVDKEGFIQPLAGYYRTKALISALSQFDTHDNRSMKSLITHLVINPVEIINQEYLLDIDTPQELEVAQLLRYRIPL